jgi:hypothetical protein
MIGSHNSELAKNLNLIFDDTDPNEKIITFKIIRKLFLSSSISNI